MENGRQAKQALNFIPEGSRKIGRCTSPGMTTLWKTWRTVESHGKRPFSWWPTSKNGAVGLPNVLDTGWT